MKKIINLAILMVFSLLSYGQSGSQNLSKETMAPYVVRTNLLSWAAAAPSVGFEWRATDNLGLAIDGEWSPLGWRDGERAWKVWNLNPQAKWYFNGLPLYAGVHAHFGEFNFKLSEYGYQGDHLGFGVTIGYILPIGKRLALDFNLGGGLSEFKFLKYYTQSGTRIAEERDRELTWYGPNLARVTLCWNLAR